MKFGKMIVTAAAACLLLVSCGGGEKDITVDINALADELHTGVTYEDTLEKLDDDMVKMLYEVDGLVTESVVYMGSGATAEEIAVFACNDVDTAKNEVKPVVDARVQTQIEAFQDYVPGEVAKLEKAVVRQSGKYVALSVSNDPDAANKILDAYMK